MNNIRRRTTIKSKNQVHIATLIGRTVKDFSGEIIGTVQDLVVEANKGVIAYILVDVKNKQTFAIPFNAIDLTKERDTVHLKMAISTFEQSMN